MEILAPSKVKIKEDLTKLEVLESLETKVKEWMSFHLSKRKLWFSSDFINVNEYGDEDRETFFARLSDRAKGIKKAGIVALAVNLLTEEGLPHIHRLISTHVVQYSFWSK